MKNYKKENCRKFVRSMHKYYGLTYLLVGRHAFEWSIIEEKDNKPFRETIYPNRKEAIKEFNKYKLLKEKES